MSTLFSKKMLSSPCFGEESDFNYTVLSDTILYQFATFLAETLLEAGEDLPVLELYATT